jgi:hypothetical protein
MISIALHKSFNSEDIARICERLAHLTSLEGRIRTIIDLVEPICRVCKFSLKAKFGFKEKFNLLNRITDYLI